MSNANDCGAPPKHGAVCWNELNVQDVQRAIQRLDPAAVKFPVAVIHGRLSVGKLSVSYCPILSAGAQRSEMRK